MAIMLRAEGLGKSFRHTVAGAPRTFRHWVEGGFLRRRPKGRFWALKDVGFDVAKGEMVGVIGHNGSGKSTLLRLLGGVMQPSAGRVTAAAPVHGLLELNTGMHPDLSGRENILINGVLGGLLKREVRDRIDRIIAFAELQDHIDDPVRTYSSGMKLRLGFAIAVHVDPEILLIDEVLAVGDMAFQQKCLARIADFKAGGSAIVLISHDLGQVKSFCDKVVWMDRGAVRAIGPAEEVVAAYQDAVARDTALRTRTDLPDRLTAQGVTLRAGENWLGSQEATLSEVALLDESGLPVERITSGSPLVLRASIASNGPATPAHVSVSIANSDHVQCLDVNTANDGVLLPPMEAPLRVDLRLDRLDLAPGRYRISVGLWEPGWSHAYDFHKEVYALEVIGGPKLAGVLSPPRHWVVNDRPE